MRGTLLLLQMSDRIPSGFESMGEPVPHARKSIAVETLRKMKYGFSTEDEMNMVEKMAEYIENDEPFEAIEAAREKVDETGAYRLLAVLCTAPVNE